MDVFGIFTNILLLLIIVPSDNNVVAAAAKVTSNFENYWQVSVNRDCGYSIPLSRGRAFWLFCDTAWTDLNGNGHFIAGSTAAVGPYGVGSVPDQPLHNCYVNACPLIHNQLNEVPTPPKPLSPPPYYGAPEQFMGTPAGLLNRNGQPCTPNGQQFPVSWITGMTIITPAQLIITYQDLCVTPFSASNPFFFQRFGIAEYNAATNSITARTAIFSTAGTQLPATKLLGSPIYTGGFLYLYGFHCSAWSYAVCTRGATYLVRAKNWHSPANYQWYSNGQFTSNNALATNVIPSAPVGLSVHPGLRAVIQKDLGGGFEIWQASAPAGPWMRRYSGKVNCSGGTGGNLCRALIGHPELSPAGHLMVSFFNPASNHLEAALFPS